MTLTELVQSTYEMFRPPKPQTVSEWADRNRILVSESSSEPGPWRTERAKYQKEPMDAFTQQGIWKIVIKSSSQVGKSEIELNMMGRAIDDDPGPILYVQPNNEVAEDYSKRRIAPMIEGCPSLRRKVSEAKGRDSNNTISMKTFSGGSIAIVGANSPAGLASKPVRYIFLDEVDRFPASAGTEGDPIELAERRTETYKHNRKIVITSTPTVKGVSKIEKAYRTGTQEEWHTECPHCHSYNFIKFDDIKFEKEEFQDEDGETNYHILSIAWCCPICKREISEHQAKRCPAKWVSKNPGALDNGIRSFWLNAFMSPWSDWKEIALKFLTSKDDVEKLKVFHNTYLGEVFEFRTGNETPEKLFNRREHYNAEVPTGVLVLTMGIDTQDNRLEYEVVGWSREGESWGISRGIIPGRADAPGVWEEVDNLLDREWKMKNGMSMRVLAAFCDSGGHFTDEVYAECAKRISKRLYAVKGEVGEGKQHVRLMKKAKDGNPAAKFIIGVDAGKEAIMYETTIEQPGAKYMHFPTDYRCGYDMEYFKGLISERLIIHRRAGKATMAWEKIRERNEPLDCRNYARAAFRYFNWNFDKYEKAINGDTEEPPITKAQAAKKKRKTVISTGIKV